MDGILNINKPTGPTSHDIVSGVRRIVGQKRVGHAGTLDPMASGLLLVCLGEATRVSEILMDRRKSYRATAVFGATTDSEDASGEIMSEKDASYVTEDMLARMLARFTGDIMQVPPMVSAIRHQGRRLYELARAGVTVERAPRMVTIYAIRLLEFRPGVRAEAVIDIDCSKGTYIRTLCADLGDALGCGGYMGTLVRTAVGRFSLDGSVSMDALGRLAAEGRLGQAVHSVDEALADLPCVEVLASDVPRIMNGVALPCDRLPEGGSAKPDAPIRIKSPDGRLLALGYLSETAGEGTVLRPRKVFAGGQAQGVE